VSVYEGHGVTLHHADCLDVLRSLPDCSVDSVVCDPPYALGFMGREWDTFGMDVGRGAQARSQRRAEVTPTGEGHSTSAGPYLASGVDSLRAAGLPFQRWCEAWATECLRVLKPGGHLLAFGGTRTWHRLACAVEDAGFEVRDSIAWLYGSGFPKSLDVSKAIDKAAGAEREASGVRGNTRCGYLDRGEQCPGHDDAGQSMSGATVHRLPTAPATDAAREWEGWGTALKPAFEPVVVARKPLVGTVAANVLAWGTGALNVDGCRVEGPKPDTTRGASVNASSMAAPLGGQGRILDDGKGRWPANVVLDESQAAALDEQSGESRDGTAVKRNRSEDGRAPYEASSYMITDRSREDQTYGGQGGASRFFYVAKADASERPRVNGTAHPTVKPLDLMRWLVRLVTPPGGTVLEPFAGSGTTVEACIIEGFQCIAIEREADYLPLIRQRIDRRRDPVEALRGQAADLGLFDLLGGEGA
jgi:DNA modification methylase